MAFRIGDYVRRGELNNSRRNSVNGWLEFGENEGIRIELTGNLAGDLAGKHLRFQTTAPRPTCDEAVMQQLDALEVRQIGVVGDTCLRIVRVPRSSAKEFYIRSKLGEPPPVDERPCLYLEWYSQNGRVVAEIVDPEITFGPEDDPKDDQITPRPLADPESVGLEMTGIAVDDEGNVEEFSLTDEDEPDEDEPDEDNDPYRLFPADLDEQLDQSIREANDASAADEKPSGPRSWDEVIPGIDDETRQMYEMWDEIAHGEKDEPLATLFDPPLPLKRPDQIADPAEADAALHVLLARLALHCVAIDVCEHFTALDTYRWLLSEILPEAQIHPQLGDTGFVQHYSTWESCPQCEAEFEADWQSRHPDESGDSDSSADSE